MATNNPSHSPKTPPASFRREKVVIFLLRVAWIALICLALLLALYLPVNNVVEYWPPGAEDMSSHFVIFTFLELVFFGLFGTSLWAKASHRARWLASLAILGWLVDLIIISNNEYLQNTSEPYVVGSMVIFAPCFVLLLDRSANTIQENLRRRNVLKSR